MPKTDKTERGLMAGADPTAPGGMSQQQLADELAEKHHYPADRVRDAFHTGRKEGWDLSKWTEMINAVCQERLMREHEAAQKRSRLVNHGVVFVPDEEAITEAETAAAFKEAHADDLLDDLDQLMAEFEEDQYEAGVEQAIEASASVNTGLVAHPAFEKFKAKVLENPEARAAYEVVNQPAPLFIGLPGTADYIFDGHMGIGPSGAERWMTCTASVAAVRRFLETLTPNQQAKFAHSGTAARQGTTAHAAAEVEANVLLGRMDTSEAEQRLIELAIEPETDDEAYNEEMAEYITEYTDLIRSYADTRGAENVLIEQVVEAHIPLMTVDSDGEQNVHSIRGSADCIVLPTRTDPVLVVDDLKYGNGIDVDVDENPQVRIYAIGALDLVADPETGQLPEWLDTVTYHIIQPRLGGIKTYTESVDSLLDWRDEVLSLALTEASGGLKAGATFRPNEVSCQWCPVRGACPALAKSRLESAGDLFDVIVEAEYEDGPGAFPETAEMDSATLGKLYAQIRGLTTIAADLKAEAERRLYRGEQVPGFGLVNYTPPRKWAPEAEQELAEHDAARALFTEKLITPTAAEKILGDEGYAQIEEWVIKPDKRPVIAPEGDRRKKWEGRAPEDMFNDEGTE